MFGTLAAAALALCPAQTGTLALTNARTTYGELGAVRTDNKYLPGDFFFLAFDMEGFAVTADGKVSYEMTFQVADRSGKVVFKSEKPDVNETFLVLGGNRLPGRAFLGLELNQAPGTYTGKVTVTDRVAKVTKTLERSFEVVPKALGLIGLMLSYDSEAQRPAPPIGVVGQTLHLHTAVVGFGRGADKKTNATVELRIVDENQKPTTPKPLIAVVPKDLADGNDLALAYFQIPLNREGTFTAEVKANDATTGKSSTVTFPIRVLPPAK
jgi:hypothetical protein